MWKSLDSYEFRRDSQGLPQWDSLWPGGCEQSSGFPEWLAEGFGLGFRLGWLGAWLWLGLFRLLFAHLVDLAYGCAY